MKKTFLLTVIALFFVLCFSGCESKKEKHAKFCSEIQKKVDALNEQYGSWSKVPENLRNEINSIPDIGTCTIIGNNIWDTSFQLKTD